MDEVTGVTGDWASQIKWLRDNDSAFREATVVLTGSKASQLSLAAGSLAGRRGRADNVDRTLLPMGFRSFAAIWFPEIKELPAIQPHQVHSDAGAAAFTVAIPWLHDLVRLWEVYLQYGGFPVAVAAAKVGQPVPTWFADALFDVVHRDAFANGSLDAAQTSNLLTRLWASVSTPVNLNSIAEDIGISQPTVARHIQYLRDAYLLWRCPQLDREWTPKDRAQEKLYPIDPIIARLPHLRRASRPDPDPTVMAEAQLGTAIRRAILRDQKSWDADTSIFYLRTATRKEIDFTSEEFAGAGIEAKYIDGGNWRREAGTLDASTYRGLLCTRSVLDLSAGSGGTWAVPTALLAALVDS